MPFHARNLIPQEDLKAGRRKAAGQTEVIKGIFRANRYRTFTPFEIMRECESMGFRWVLTSVRRAITDLTNEGLLRKTDEHRAGGYAMTNRTWTWMEEPPGEGQLKLQL